MSRLRLGASTVAVSVPSRVTVLRRANEDFVRLLEAMGAPTQALWVTVGNVRSARLRTLFERHWSALPEQLLAGEPLVELSDA